MESETNNTQKEQSEKGGSETFDTRTQPKQNEMTHYVWPWPWLWGGTKENPKLQTAKEDMPVIKPNAEGIAKTNSATLALLRATQAKFTGLFWSGSVEIKAIIDAPGKLLSSSFAVKGIFGLARAKGTLSTPAIAAVCEPPSPDHTEKFFLRLLERNLSWIQEHVEGIAFVLRDFQMTGKIGFIFYLGLPPTTEVFTAGAAVRFEITLELSIDSIIVALKEDQIRARAQEIEKLKKMIGVTEAEAAQAYWWRRPTILRRRDRELKQLEEMEKGKSSKEDQVIRSMLFSMETIRLKLRALGYSGNARVQANFGFMAVFIQLSFRRDTKRVTFWSGKELAPQKEEEKNEEEKKEEEEEHVKAEVVEEMVEYVDAVSGVVEGAKKEEEKKAMEQKGGRFSKELDKGLEIVKSLAEKARINGFTGGLECTSSFGFSLLGFGISTTLQIQARTLQIF